MSLLIQHLLVGGIVAACVAYVGWQLSRALGGGRSKAGSCCAKGCDGQKAADASPRATGGTTQFIASETLTRRARDRVRD